MSGKSNLSDIKKSNHESTLHILVDITNITTVYPSESCGYKKTRGRAVDSNGKQRNKWHFMRQLLASYIVKSGMMISGKKKNKSAKEMDASNLSSNQISRDALRRLFLWL